MSALGKYKILELSEGVSGEYCGKLLADFGAQVVKIEKPGAGSPTRRMYPVQKDAGVEGSGLFAYLNTNKMSVELDIESESGQKALHQLIEKVDIVVDDHASGWLASVGLSPEELGRTYPNVIVCSITAYGQNPPDDRRYAEDLTVFHSSGWGYHTPGGGYDDKPPLKGPGRFLVSYESGMDAAMYVAAAVYEREGSGKGQFIDVSMHEVMASRGDYVLAQFVAGEMDVRESRAAYDLAGPGGIFPCKDGFVYAWLAMPMHWQALRQMLNETEWMDDFPEDWLEKGLTPERVALCREHLAAWAQDKYKDDAAAEAQKLGLTLVAVNYPRDLLRCPQYRHRKYFQEVEHPCLGKALYPTVPYRLSETPAEIKTAAPSLGQNSGEFLPGGGR